METDIGSTLVHFWRTSTNSGPLIVRLQKRAGLPKVAESVIVSYCDFCQETSPSTKATSGCWLCGALLCYRHAVNVEFLYDNPYAKEEREDSRLGLWVTDISHCGGRICPECASHATLGEIAARLKEASINATAMSIGRHSKGKGE